MKQQGWWWSLEHFLRPAAVPAAWRDVLGDEFRDARPFLPATNENAEEHPCTQRPRCGCEHEIIHHTPTRSVAACRCDGRECRTFTLRREDILIHALDGRKLCAALREACGFDALPDPNAPKNGEPVTWVVGAYGELQSPVYLVIRQKEPEFFAEMERLMSAQREPFIVLAPTERHLTQPVRAALQRHQCAFIPLSRHLSWDGAEKFKASSLDAILQRFKRGLLEGDGLGRKLAEFGRDLKAVARGNYELRKENEELHRMAADGYLKFVRTIEPLDFCCFVFILAYGDRAKAARALEMKERTFYERVESWAARGPDYRRMFALSKCRKTALSKGTIPLGASVQSAGVQGDAENPKTIQGVLDRLHEGSLSQGVYPDVLQEVFNALVEMNANNWVMIRKELMENIQEEVPQ